MEKYFYMTATDVRNIYFWLLGDNFYIKIKMPYTAI